ncbi:MAG TPA: GlcNAc-transferase family protein [Burkholderiaceae bacterium]|nr:GlcNAc-transferase family protein [Burkholderiaceae bacterium]
MSRARNIAFSLYGDEAFLLQIDSHTLFEPDWNDILRSQHKALLARSFKPIVTA